jgi:hypothetical protein
MLIEIDILRYEKQKKNIAARRGIPRPSPSPIARLVDGDVLVGPNSWLVILRRVGSKAQNREDEFPLWSLIVSRWCRGLA